MNYVLITAGGKGSRMIGAKIPKQFIKVDNIPLIMYTLDKFVSSKFIDGVVISCLPEYIDFLEECIEKRKYGKPISVIQGGLTGQESIYNGLCELRQIASPNDLILIHDAVRPFIDDNLIKNNIDIAEQNGNCISCSPCFETIVVCDNGVIEESLCRDKCMIARAPQTFKLRDLVLLHERARKENNLSFVDSSSLFAYYGYKLYYCYCDNNNIKITTNDDLSYFEFLIDKKNK